MSNLLLQNVRIAYPNLYVPSAFSDGGKLRYGSVLLFPKEHPAYGLVVNAMREVAKAKWGAKGDEIVSLMLRDVGPKGPTCLHDGAFKPGSAGYAGNWYVSANSNVRPKVYDKQKRPLDEKSDLIYPGCYVHASIDLWAQQHESGKKINGTLLGIMFARDGDRLVGAAPSTGEEFDAFVQVEDSLF